MWEKTSISMDTLVSIQIVSSSMSRQRSGELIDSAMAAFYDVERICSRFDPESELMQLARHAGEPIPVSPVLFEAIRFACTMAEMTSGKFDPTVGRQQELFGFNRHYLSGTIIDTAYASTDVSYRDITLDESLRTVMLQKPLVIDLGAVAKGLAIDMAARILRDVPAVEGFIVNAGGDVYVAGVNERSEPWRIGIRHPQNRDEVICTVRLTDTALCTSGSYERKSPLSEGTHHLLLPGLGESQNEVISCSVIAPYAMMADALSTAAFVLGPIEGMTFMTSSNVDGLMMNADMELKMTKHMKRYIDG